MEIRPLRPEEAETLFRMMRVFYDSPAVLGEKPDDALRRDIADCLSELPFVECFVCAEGESLLGYTMIAHSYSTEVGGRCVWIEDLYVDPNHRRRGIGRGLLRFVEERYASVARRFRLEVEPENETACALYSSLDYEVLPYEQRIREIENI